MTLKKSIGYFLLIILFCGLILLLISLIQNPTKMNGVKNFLTKDLRGDLYNKSITNTVENSKLISLQQVKNLGYNFYLGEIEHPNTTNLTEDLKNQVTKIVYDANFPKKLLKTTAIIFVNTLAIESEQEIVEPNGHHLKIPDSFFSPKFISGGGFYVQTEEEFSIIFLNKNKIGKPLADTLTHELGHHLSSILTDSDWQNFYKLRGIPAGTPLDNKNKLISPKEDFAEVYKSISTGLNVKTSYGSVGPKTKDFINMIISRPN